MILSDHTIKDYVSRHRIYVDPEPEEEQYQPASLDLRLGEEVVKERDGSTYRLDEADEIALEPGEFYLGHTKEFVELPYDVAGLITGRSSVGRMGVIVHATAGFVDPGFAGELTLELCNFNHEPAELAVGDRVAQMMFFPLDETSTGYDGQYAGQTGVTESGEL